MARRRVEVLAYALALTGLLGVIGLVGAGRPVPQSLWLLEFGLVGGALGITVPRR